MKNRQTPKRKTMPETAPKRTPSRVNRIAENSFYFLLYMTQRHPILFWTGSWLGMILISWLAISGLTYTNPAPLEVVESPQPAAIAESPKPEPQFQQPRQSGNSIAVLAAVAISCAGVSVLLGRQLRPAKPVPKRAIKRNAEPQLAERTTPLQTERAIAPRQTAKKSTAARTTANRTPRPVPQPQRVPVAAAPVAKTAARPAPQRSPQPQVTVMPAEVNHPLDWEDENLAEVMDIRKRPVSFDL